jgi:hypothetical protein
MNDYSKLYCKVKNLLKIIIKNREYSYGGGFRGESVDSLKK